MKLSVLITTYNLKEYIGNTLDSIIAQIVNFDYEIIIGDDGSTDGTIEIINSYRNRYPELISCYIMPRDPNLKYNKIIRASQNRMNILKHAKGEYFTFIDGDDFYINNYKLQNQIDEFEKPENCDCIAISDNAELYWSEDKIERINNYIKKAKIDGRDYWKYNLYFLSNCIIYRNIYLNKEKYYKLKANYENDYDDNIILFSMLMDGKILFIPETNVAYRQIESSSWHSVNEAEKNIINLMDVDFEIKVNPSFRKESIARHTYNMLMLYINRKNITNEIYEKYHKIAVENNYDITIKWLEYTKQPFYKKILLSLELLCRLIRYSFTFAGRILFIRRNLL